MRYFIILFSGLILATQSAVTSQPDIISFFNNKEYEYQLKYKGIGSASAVLSSFFSSPDSGQMNIRLHVKTSGLFNLLFHVNNTYDTLVDTASWRPIRISNNIDQENIVQNLSIEFNWQKLLATTSNGFQYDILPDCMTIFTLMYRLRTSSLHTEQKLVFSLDTESLLWIVEGRVDSLIYKNPCKNLKAKKITFDLSAAANKEPRPWKTDLLTNRLGKSNATITFVFGPEPWNIPLRIQFGEKENQVDMIIKSCPQEYQ
ncbi:DUF3108 domain-containing protein [candidate division KSB1 bacterium]|nr:DUF3108 domain-containing protein [candidate division KSB1 bacterium]